MPIFEYEKAFQPGVLVWSRAGDEPGIYQYCKRIFQSFIAGHHVPARSVAGQIPYERPGL